MSSPIQKGHMSHIASENLTQNGAVKDFIKRLLEYPLAWQACAHMLKAEIVNYTYISSLVYFVYQVVFIAMQMVASMK